MTDSSHRDTDNRDPVATIRYLEARVEALQQRVAELEKQLVLALSEDRPGESPERLRRDEARRKSGGAFQR